jgi:alpha-beta hydrolase superfamily lysophospholipase
MHARRRLQLQRAAVIAAALVGLWLFASFAVMRQLCARHPSRIANPAAIDTAGVERVEISTHDGERLAAIWLAPPDAKTCVILLHGSGESRARWYPLLPWLAEHRVAALMPDLRAHGESTGEHNDFGWSARGDVIACVEWIRGRSDVPIGVAGYSMGAVAAIFAAPELGMKVGGYLLESPYSTLDHAVSARLARILPFPLDAIAHAGLSLCARFTLDFDPERDSPRNTIGRMPPEAARFFLTATEDERTRIEDVRELAALAGPRAVLTVYSGEGHRPLAARDLAQYETHLAALLDATMANAPLRPAHER